MKYLSKKMHWLRAMRKYSQKSCKQQGIIRRIKKKKIGQVNFKSSFNIQSLKVKNKKKNIDAFF